MKSSSQHTLKSVGSLMRAVGSLTFHTGIFLAHLANLYYTCSFFLAALNFPNSISKTGERERGATASSRRGCRSNYKLKCCERNECGCFYSCGFIRSVGGFTLNVFNLALKNGTGGLLGSRRS